MLQESLRSDSALADENTKLKTCYRAPRRGAYCWPADVPAGDAWYLDPGDDWDDDMGWVRDPDEGDR